jgi:DNA integrity scanning protein DisA with diadenylate cyclase activity
MRKIRTAFIAMGAVLILPALSLAGTGAVTAQPTSATSSYATTAKVPTHSTRGVVKSIDETRLVIERSPQYAQSQGNMSLALNPSTEGLGDVKVGSTVVVRYRTEAHQRIATAVMVEHAKTRASASGAHQ